MRSQIHAVVRDGWRGAERFLEVVLRERLKRAPSLDHSKSSATAWCVNSSRGHDQGAVMGVRRQSLFVNLFARVAIHKNQVARFAQPIDKPVMDQRRGEIRRAVCPPPTLRGRIASDIARLFRQTTGPFLAVGTTIIPSAAVESLAAGVVSPFCGCSLLWNLLSAVSTTSLREGPNGTRCR
jgi:hypothetical protein